MGLNSRWVEDTDVDTKDCKYVMNYIANYNQDDKFLNVVITLFVNEINESVEYSMSVKSDNPNVTGPKMIEALITMCIKNRSIIDTIR